MVAVLAERVLSCHSVLIQGLRANRELIRIPLASDQSGSGALTTSERTAQSELWGFEFRPLVTKYFSSLTL
jgi:hypothetical protein